MGFKLLGGLAKEHIELVLAPPAAGKSSCATVIARSLNDAPALLNGMPLPVSVIYSSLLILLVSTLLLQLSGEVKSRRGKVEASSVTSMVF